MCANVLVLWVDLGLELGCSLYVSSYGLLGSLCIGGIGGYN